MKPDLKAIRARADACFRAPWTAGNFVVECEHTVDDCSRCAGEGETEVERIESPDEYPEGQVIADVPGLQIFSEPHSTFIAAARTDVPALCDYAEDLERQLADVPRQIARARAEATTETRVIADARQEEALAELLARVLAAPLRSKCALCGGDREACGHFVGGGAL